MTYPELMEAQVRPAAATAPPDAVASGPSVRRHWLIALGLLALATYANSFQAALTLDNKIVLLRDPRIAGFSWENIVGIFRENYWWPSFPSDLYRPLTTLSYWVNYTLFGGGPDPTGYHWVNFALHLANATLVLGLLRRLRCSWTIAGIAAGLFVAHPVNVESVTNIVGRADLMATFFVLSALHFHILAGEGGSRRRRWFWSIGLGLAAILGELSKENAIVLVGCVLLYEVLFKPSAPRGTGQGKRLFLNLLPLLPALAIFLGARVILTRKEVVPWQYFVDNPIAGAGLFQGFMTAIRIQGSYLKLLVWPSNLTCDYSYDHVPLYGTQDRWTDVSAWFSLAVIIAIVGFAWKHRRSQAALCFGVLWYFGAMFPTSNLVKAIGSVMAERFMYLPSIGFVVAAAVILERFPRVRRLGWAPVILVIGALAVRAHLRNRDWRDDLALWSSAVRVAPDSFKTHKGLAETYFHSELSEKAVDAAIREAEKGVAILDRAEVESRIERRDVTLFIDLGKYYKAKADLRALSNDLPTAADFGEKSVAVLKRAATVDAWVNQESRRTLLARGTPPEEIHPVGRPDLHQALAMVYFQSSDFANAIRSAYAAAQLAPDDPGSWLFIARCSRMMGRPDKANVSDLMAVLVSSRFAPAWADLQRGYAQSGLKTNPITVGKDGRYQLDGTQPQVRSDMKTACALYDHFMREGNYSADADNFRLYARRYFHLAPWDPAEAPKS